MDVNKPKDKFDSFNLPIDEDEGATLTWRTHPVKRKPLVSLGVTLLIISTPIIVYYGSHSAAFAALSLIVMTASLAKFYFPTIYRLSDKRIIVKTTTQMTAKEWSLYRSYYPDKNGILLSPFVAPSRMENFRGLYLMFDNNKEQVVSFVAARVSEEPKP